MAPPVTVNRMLPGHLLNKNGTRESAVSTATADPLFRVGRWLRDSGYRFVTVTPSTHARVLRRACRRTAESPADIFGWNLPFHPGVLPRDAVQLLESANALEKTAGGLLRSKIRFSTLGDSIYLHSGYPTLAGDAVFFGPDTYRFVSLIGRSLPLPDCSRIRSIADIGCGSGAGGLAAAKLLGDRPYQLLLADINPRALSYAAINAALAGLPDVGLRQGDLYAPLDGTLDLILANPPYLVDAEARLYRHGGGELGCGLALRIVAEGLPRLAAAGTLILYTATPVVAGRDIFREALNPLLRMWRDLDYDYREIDPDVFGEELDNPAYSRVERLAAVSLVARKGDRADAATARRADA